MAPVDLKTVALNVQIYNSQLLCMDFRTTDAQNGKWLRQNSDYQSQEEDVTLSKCLNEFDSLSTGLIDETLLRRIRRGVFAYIDLDVIGENISLLKKLCRNPDIRVIGVVKGNACGHGAVPVSRYLTETKAVDRLAVANIPEAIQLRRAGVEGVIHVLGNTQPWAMDQCIRYQLVPTVATQEAARGMAEAIEKYKRRVEEESILLEEPVAKYQEQIEELQEMMDQFVFQEQRRNSSTEPISRSQQNSQTNRGHSPNHYMAELLSNVCNERIEQLQNNINRLLQKKQILGCWSTDKMALSGGVKYRQSNEMSNILRKSADQADVQLNSDAVLGAQWHSDSVPINGVERNGKNGAVKDCKEDVTLNQKDDVTLRYTSGIPLGTVHIKVDTGMSRNGCQPQELDSLVQVCKDVGVHVEGIFTHICNHEDPVYSKHQMDTFRKCTKRYQNQGLLLHVSNSGSVLNDIGTDLPMIRPGLAIYGMSPGMNLDEFSSFGFRPSMTIKGTPSLVKRCLSGTKIGYGCAYTCPEDEWIATFPVGYADGICRDIGKTGSQYVIRDLTGEKCPLVGRISMDAITVRVPEKPKPGELFTLISADYDPVSSITGISRTVESIEHETLTRISSRLPRVYKHTTSGGTVHNIWPALDLL